MDSKISRDHPNYQEHRRLQRSIVFRDRVENPAVLSKIIFTGMMLLTPLSVWPILTPLDFQSNNELGRNVVLEYQTAARRSNRLFIPVYLLCDVEENLRRVTDPQRARTQTSKLLDRSVVHTMRLKSKLFRFDTSEDLSLDVSYLTSAEAAQRILSHVRTRLRGSKVDNIGFSHSAKSLKYDHNPPMGN